MQNKYTLMMLVIRIPVDIVVNITTHDDRQIYVMVAIWLHMIVTMPVMLMSYT